MKRLKPLSRKIFATTLLISVICLSANASAGTFVGNLVFEPEGCRSSPAGICKLGEKLKYHSSRNNLVWQADQ
ncbi:MAG: hypothetical protein GY748_23965 [Planctomycetaceae bacterium]|nr:hypothetical protein [Planctomycetaceae bacterium]